MIARANRELPEGSGPLSSAEAIARQLRGFVVDGVEVSRLGTARIQAFSYSSPYKRLAAAAEGGPMFLPRWVQVQVFVKEPFEYLNGGGVAPRVFCGVQEVPKALADLSVAIWECEVGGDPPHVGRRPYPALLGLESDSWFPDTASSSILGADVGSHLEFWG